MKFRKKPIVIDAVEFDGDTETLKMFGVPFEQDFPEDAPKINTLEGKLIISFGDWVIRGVNGEYYPCKPDIFEKTYERID